MPLPVRAICPGKKKRVRTRIAPKLSLEGVDTLDAAFYKKMRIKF